MKVFEQFRWPVPFAFKDALAVCRFEKGDILYSDECAYDETWGEALEKLRYSIQLVTPERSAQGKTEAETGLFSSNWKSAVVATLYNHRTGSVETIETNQGAIYTCWWKGDISTLDRTIPPEQPKLIRELHKDIKDFDFPKGKFPRFYILADRTNDLQEGKIERITTTFKTQITKKQRLPAFRFLSLAEEGILPTIEICYFEFSESGDFIRDGLKKALYTPATNRNKKEDRFRLIEHGYLQKAI